MKLKTFGPISDLERHLPENWWKTLFNSIYLKTDGDVVENDDNTRMDIDLLIKQLNLTKDQKLLDLCCGQGRHVLELAKRGFSQVSGLDRSKYLIRLARKRASQLGLAVKFSEGDARKIRYNPNTFDVVYMMGNSFGYFEREEDDHAILDSIKMVLKSEGKILLDLMNGQWMRENMEPRSWEWIDQNHFVCRERSLSKDKKRVISREVITHAEKGVIADQFYAERLYDSDQISVLLKSLGFKDIQLLDNISSESTRGHDLGMMANRFMVSALAPVKKSSLVKKEKTKVTVLLGDPHLFDPVKKDQHFSKEDIETVTILKKELASLTDYEFSYLDSHQNYLKSLESLKTDWVVNFCDEGYRNNPAFELHIPAMLEMMGKNYSGANPDCLSLCYNKSLVRALAMMVDIPVPEETYLDPSDNAASIPSIFPAFIKPNSGDGSYGITQASVVYQAEQLIKRLDELKDMLPDKPILIQEYLTGNEYSVGIIGNPGSYTVLPILEVDYSQLPENLPKILAYESKWHPESPYWDKINYQPASLSEETQRLLVDYSTRLFERTGCRDYARFDFRADHQGVIKLLEVNPNPGWCWDGKLSLMASFEGIGYGDLLQMILSAVQRRISR